jgi:hypothetical protein
LFVSTVFGAYSKSGSFGFAEGSAYVSGNAKCATYAVAEITQDTLIFNGVRECSAFQFFCAKGCFIFSGSSFLSPSWSAGLYRYTAKLSALLKSFAKSSQDVKGRWF